MRCVAPALSVVLTTRRLLSAVSLSSNRCRPLHTPPDRSSQHRIAHSRRYTSAQEASALHSSIHTLAAMTEFPDIVLSAGKSKVRSQHHSRRPLAAAAGAAESTAVRLTPVASQTACATAIADVPLPLLSVAAAVFRSAAACRSLAPLWPTANSLSTANRSRSISRSMTLPSCCGWRWEGE